MITALSFFLGLIIGALVGYFITRKTRTNSGIAAIVEHRSIKKQKRKEQIIALVQQKGTIANNDVEKFLNVSDATATNYIQELEEEGKIKQIGERGRFVTYRLATAPSAKST
ncbi:DeoR family transcriptional regulator [Candidatus Uhrbacteria bacterium]|nr:DeoR family transcriptional regulator [Candidatus Uhrbacteria bacterium]